MNGTFRLNNNQILVTPTAANLTTVVTLSADPTNPTTVPLTGDNALGGLGLQLNHEDPLGTYTLNGNVLALTYTGDSSPTNFDKQ